MAGIRARAGSKAAAILGLFAALLLLGCPTTPVCGDANDHGCVAHQFSSGETTRSSPTSLGDSGIERAVDDLLARMTLAEKVGQLSQASALTGTKLDDAVRVGLTGSVMWVDDAKRINELQRIAVEETRLGIPLLFALDVVHGYHTVFPVGLGMAASWDPDLYEATQAIAAREARAAGIHWTFAPTVDITRDPRWGRMVEGPGEDPYLASAMAAAQVRGFQGPFPGSAGRLIACAKHLAGYGAAEGGRDYDPVYLPEGLLRNVYLPPFRAAVEAGAGSIMTAYMDLNDVPATVNPFLLRRVLRDEWGFEGFVISDFRGLANLLTQGLARDGSDAARRGMLAGLGIDMASQTYEQHLSDVVESGEVPTELLDEALRPILTAKFRMGLFDAPYADESALAKVLADPSHRELARVAARRSMVLLRNESQTLPLDKESGSIAVIGSLADSRADMEGSWTVVGHPPAAITILEGIRDKVGDNVEVTHAPGPQIRRTVPSPWEDVLSASNRPYQSPEAAEAAFQEAVATARVADRIVLVLGETAHMSGEVASRGSLDLPGRQQDLLEEVVALGKPVVLVLINGRPLTIGWAATNVPAILEAWQPGTEGGHAVADLLFGDANPGGKLPVTFPRESSHAPLYYARNLTHQPEHSPGYRSRYWDGPSTPLYPFGYGLSYATFDYSHLRLVNPEIAIGQTTMVRVDLQNSGNVAGDEVVQLYVHQRSGSDSRPMRELKGFRRVTLRPGEKRTISFELGPDQLRYWSSARGRWIQEAAIIDVWVGGDSMATKHAELRVVPRIAEMKSRLLRPN